MIDSLAQALMDSGPNDSVWRLGTVTQVSPLLVKLGAATTGQPCRSGVGIALAVNDFVVVLLNGPDRVVVSSLTDVTLAAQPARNVLMNGAFLVNQRGFTSTSTDQAYGFDRWFLQKSGGTVTMSLQAVTLGSPPAAGYEVPNVLRLASSGSPSWSMIAQRIEDVRTFAGAQVTVSFWAKASSGTPTVAPTLRQNFGSGGSPSAFVDTGAAGIPISTTWARYSATITLPSIAGKTIGTTAFTSSLELMLQPTINTTIDFWGIQLERGAVATPFELIEYGVELARCQRYYTTGSFRSSAGYIYSGNFGWGSGTLYPATFPVRMRVVPTLSTSFSNVDNAANNGTTATVDGVYINVTVGSTAYTYNNWYATFTASAEF